MNWAVYCRDDDWPGLWRCWEERQIATVGWPPGWGFRRDGKNRSTRGWTIARNCLDEMRAGDRIVARLPHHRIGRVGTILELKVADDQWDPQVVSPEDAESGEQGRCILVRWDFSVGPSEREYACTLPEAARLNPGHLRTAISRVPDQQFDLLAAALRDSVNWAPAFAHRFDREGALSDFIATHPERIEPGLRPVMCIKVREQSLPGTGRVDVLLRDARGRDVVIECKQDHATVGAVRQLRRYMGAVRKKLKLPTPPRGVLVVGGAPAVTAEVRAEAGRAPAIEIFAHRLDVVFSRVADR